ncbi:hypothetical protein [Arcobacter porcinus]|uniref:Uncharacterized protein n=1 Tax=Arcobacter porcinus TaxID=1935204 RepID=A0ABX2YDL7_9BACT|nr:hypothetical protein [Arcobacter porcinus]OCL93031.1 hypothetical protein AAX28_00571 [Arcobacter porcinus]
MKKILTILIFLSSFSFSNTVNCLYVSGGGYSPFCATKIEYAPSIRSWVFVEGNGGRNSSITGFRNISIATGYKFNTVTEIYEIDNNYLQIDVTEYTKDPNKLQSFIDNPPKKDTGTNPDDGGSTGGNNGGSTGGDNGGSTGGDNGSDNETPITPNPNPQELYKYGLTFNEFNFLSGLTGLICGFLISNSILRRI